MNDRLAHGRFFFMDIARDGIALYQADDRPLRKPTPKTPQENLYLAREYFEEWFPSAGRLRSASEYLLKEGGMRESAFNLHQAAERLYHCVNLVLTFYTPHNHNLAFLHQQAEGLDMRLIDAWPRTQRRERAMFEKLKDAYVKARYSRHYRISAEELGRIVHELCSERILTLEKAMNAALPGKRR